LHKNQFLQLEVMSPSSKRSPVSQVFGDSPEETIENLL